MMSTKIILYAQLILLSSVHFCALMPIQSLQKRDADSTTQSTTTENTMTTNQADETAQDSTTTEAPQALGAFQMINNCQCRREDDSQSCQSLENAISDFYRMEDKDYDTPYYFFSLKELFYAALLDGRNNFDLLPTPLHGVDFNTENEENRGIENCEYHMRNYNFITSDTSGCKWEYRCTQNRLQFPSFTVEAVLSNSMENCTPVTMTNKKFLRTSCSHNPSLPHWLDCDCGNTVVGYKNSLTES